MKKNKNILLFTAMQFLFIFYFLLILIIYFLSIKQGNEGIGLKLFGGGDDGIFYWIQANNVASGNEWIKTSIYPLIIGNVIKFFGIYNVIIVRILNFFIFIFLIFLSLKVFEKQFFKKELEKIQNYKFLLLFLLFIYPSLILNTTLSIYRDVWIYMLYMLSLLYSIKIFFLKEKNIKNIIILLFSIWLLGNFRDYILFSFLFSLLFYFLYKKIKMLKKNKVFFVTFLSLFSIYYTFFKNFKIPLINKSLLDGLNYRFYFLDTAYGGSQMFINLDQSNFVLFFFNYIHSYIGNLIGPLPWHISGISMLLLFFVESLPMILILIYIFKNFRLLNNINKYLILNAFIWNGIIAITNDNIGTTSRLRVISWIIFILVFVYTKYNKKKE